MKLIWFSFLTCGFLFSVCVYIMRQIGQFIKREVKKDTEREERDKVDERERKTDELSMTMQQWYVSIDQDSVLVLVVVVQRGRILQSSSTMIVHSGYNLRQSSPHTTLISQSFCQKHQNSPKKFCNIFSCFCHHLI
jgi:Na+-transporting methylmalonyl-CoA/oxaloacetate decarboxylase gamma subunit